MVSMDHLNAREMFERDVLCLRLFFRRRFGLEDGEYPTWSAVVQRVRDTAILVHDFLCSMLWCMCDENSEIFLVKYTVFKFRLAQL